MDENGTDEAPQTPIRVVIAEDSYVIREFLTTTLSAAAEVELVAVCTNGKELATAIDTWDPDVVLTDIRMPPSGADEGVRIAARLRETTPGSASSCSASTRSRRTRIGLLRARNRAAAPTCSRSGSAIKEELVGAINAVARGGSVIDPIIVDVLIDARSHAAKSQLSELTPRERQLLAEIAAGKSNGAIAESLVLTKRAVEKHVNSIFSKLNLPETQDVKPVRAQQLDWIPGRRGRRDVADHRTPTTPPGRRPCSATATSDQHWRSVRRRPPRSSADGDARHAGGDPDA